MSRFRGLLVLLMILGLVGCQTPQSVTVTEYRPKAAMINEKSTPDSEVFQLVRWTPIAPLHVPATQPVAAANPLKQMPVEVEQVYVSRGTPLGFQRTDGRLIAFAGPTTKLLEEAHYEWKTMPQSKSLTGSPRDKFNDAMTNAFGAAVVVAIVAGVLWVVHVNRHSLLEDLFNNE